jgi:hypothetical protein
MVGRETIEIWKDFVEECCGPVEETEEKYKTPQSGQFWCRLVSQTVAEDSMQL